MRNCFRNRSGCCCISSSRCLSSCCQPMCSFFRSMDPWKQRMRSLCCSPSSLWYCIGPMSSLRCLRILIGCLCSSSLPILPRGKFLNYSIGLTMSSLALVSYSCRKRHSFRRGSSSLAFRTSSLFVRLAMCSSFRLLVCLCIHFACRGSSSSNLRTILLLTMSRFSICIRSRLCRLMMSMSSSLMQRLFLSPLLILFPSILTKLSGRSICGLDFFLYLELKHLRHRLFFSF